MRYLFSIILLTASSAGASTLSDIRGLALANGFNPTDQVLTAIVDAAKRYHVDAKELTAIGILETGLGKNAKTRLNSNGTKDAGIFQINTVNSDTCIEYNLDSIQGNAYCAAKLLHSIAKRHADYLGRYHSKTPKRKAAYQGAALRILAKTQ